MLRYTFVLSQDNLTPENMEKTEDFSYHGGGLADELASLISLQMGIRIKAGKATRSFDVHGDPRGRPIAWAGWNPPILLQGEKGVVIPGAIGHHQLTKPNLIMQLPDISAKEATVLIKAARFYQEALWIAESSPELSWIMMVSAIETVSDFAANKKSSPLLRMFEYIVRNVLCSWWRSILL